MTLTLKEAIEILTDFRQQESALLGNEFSQAALLLIEAGKREVANRENPDFVMVGKLPGETME